MASSYNLCVLMGNLTKDPDLRYTKSGAAVANFGLAVNRTYTDGSGEKQEDTCFVDVVCWNRLAEVCAEFLQKGRPALVEGRLHQRSWETEEGKKRYKLEVVARSVKFLGNAKSQEDGSDGGAGGDQDVPF